VLIERCEGEALSASPAEPSFLTAADDLDVIKRLLEEGAAYSDAPELYGKVPETGVWARWARREPVPSTAAPAARLAARIAEIVRLCAWLDRGEEDPGDYVASYRLGVGKGAAAVECARGRLYHAVVLDEDKRIVSFEFLAPTEWNFHPRGPLVRSLKGAKLPAGRRGQDAVRTLVGAFDPCVGFKLDFREVGHA
jgi:Ni,Fe-hydrogenase I large subunit